MSQKIDEVWDEFEQVLRSVRERLSERWIPVAMLCLQAEEGDDDRGGLKVHLKSEATMVWGRGFPDSQRATVLDHMAKQYEKGTILRSNESGEPV